MATTFDVAAIRKHFPALSQDQVYFDNAGGSQILGEVVESISTYLLSTNAQLGGTYPASVSSARLYGDGCAATAKYINASPNEVILGPSTTQLFRNLSLGLYDFITPDSEIIISQLDHEANIASWTTLAAWRNCTIKWWTATDPYNPQLDLSVLKSLLSPKTKLVTCTHTSNILGTINDIRAISAAVHAASPDALLCVDAVAYAPHRAIDVRALGVDIYTFSWYKVYGPHISTMYVSSSAQKNITSIGHFFKPKDTLENLLGLAAANYELTASIPKVCEYLAGVSWEDIAVHEERLQGVLIEYLLSKKEVYQIYGEPVADRNKRVPVISFTVKGVKSQDVVETVEKRAPFGFRWGTFYSVRLSKAMGLDAVDGVVRVSLVHYNTEEEIRRYVKVLDEVVSEMTKS